MMTYCFLTFKGLYVVLMLRCNLWCDWCIITGHVTFVAPRRRVKKYPGAAVVYRVLQATVIRTGPR